MAVVLVVERKIAQAKIKKEEELLIRQKYVSLKYVVMEH